MSVQLTEEEIKKLRQERRNALQRLRRRLNPENRREEQRRYHLLHPDKVREERRRYRLKRKLRQPVRTEKQKQSNREREQRIKREVMQHYGNCMCACCGESHLEFLAIDHVNGGGRKHRKEIRSKGGCHFYLWLRRNGYPEGYQVLCHNCNLAKSCFGICPHKKVKV
jgi:hypothetical protein